MAKQVLVTRRKGRLLGAAVGELLLGPVGAAVGLGLGTRSETQVEERKSYVERAREAKEQRDAHAAEQWQRRQVLIAKGEDPDARRKVVNKTIGIVIGLTLLLVFCFNLGRALVQAPVPSATASQPAQAAIAASAPVAPASETRAYAAMDRDDKHAIFAAHRLVQARLRDPDSAVFDKQQSWLQDPEVLVRRIDGKPAIICGWVNAKNGFGGMTGDQAYVVNLRDGSVVIGAGSTLLRFYCSS